MRTLQNWLDDYGVSHQNRINKAIHWLCIPVIFFSSVGLLASIPHHFLLNPFTESVRPFIHFGSLAIFLALIFYIRLSVTMSIGMFIWCLFCLWGNVQIELLNPFGFALWEVSLILFAIAWVVQFVGHKIEGEKPSFVDDVQFLLIGPAWLMAFIYKSVGIKY